MRKILILVALVSALVSNMWAQTDTAQVQRTQLKNNRFVPVWGLFYSWMVTEQGNLYFTNERARAALSAISPLSYNSTTGAYSLTGLSTLGTANQIPGVNTGATGFEWKTFSGSAHILVTHGVGTLVLSLIAQSLTHTEIDTGAVRSEEMLDSTILGRDVANGELVRSLNGFMDEIVITGENGASVRIAAGPTVDTVVVSGGIVPGDSAGIFALQSTDLDVTNPNGPTTTVDIKTSGVTNGKLAANAVTTDKVAEGTLLTGDANATFKAPLAGVADSAGKAGLAAEATHATAADSAGDVKDNSITTDHVVNGTLTTPDFNAAAKAPLAGIADTAIKAALAVKSDSAGKTSHTGVAATSYGTGSNVFSATLNSEGRVTAASNVPIVITGANVTNQSLIDDDIDTVGTDGMATTWMALYYAGTSVFPSNDTITINQTGVTSSWGIYPDWYAEPTAMIVFGGKCFTGYCQIYGSAKPLEGITVQYEIKPNR